MNVLNRTLLATLTACGIAFTHGASAEYKVTSAVVKIKNPSPVEIPKIKNPNPVDNPKVDPINDKMKDVDNGLNKATSGAKDTGKDVGKSINKTFK